LSDKSEYRLLSASHSGLDPASSGRTIRKTLDSLRGEFIEPRVKPGMTKQMHIIINLKARVKAEFAPTTLDSRAKTLDKEHPLLYGERCRLQLSRIVG
jgi:hypothetical protein